MTTLSLATDLDAQSDAVWAVAGNFGDLHLWHPWVPNCSLSADGKTRTIEMGPMTAIETLEFEGDRTHTYRVDESPMPVDNYKCTWTVTPSPAGTHLTIEATFEPRGVPPEEALAMLQGFFDAAFEALAGRFGAS